MNQWGFGRVVDDVYGCPEVSVNRSGPGSRGGAGGDGGGGGGCRGRGRGGSTSVCIIQRGRFNFSCKTLKCCNVIVGVAKIHSLKPRGLSSAGPRGRDLFRPSGVSKSPQLVFELLNFRKTVQKIRLFNDGSSARMWFQMLT